MYGHFGNDTVINAAGAYALQMGGYPGNDSLINNGYLGSIGSPHQRNGHMAGGSDNDRLINEAGAVLLGSIHGDPGNDYVFNAGYAGLGLAGDSSVYGGTGNDTVINAAGAYAGFIDLGPGDDSFSNGGFVNTYGTLGSNYGVDCGDGNDTVNVGGYIIGSILCGGGDDSVTILEHWVFPGYGAAVIGTLDGGVGNDVLSFSFTVNVGSQQEADDLAAALAAASPAGGTITIAGVPYAWMNFETLIDLLTYAINMTVDVTVYPRLNAGDVAAPVAIYMTYDGLEFWTINPDSSGTFAFLAPYDQMCAGTTFSAGGVSMYRYAVDTFVVNMPPGDGSLYTFAFTWDCP